MVPLIITDVRENKRYIHGRPSSQASVASAYAPPLFCPAPKVRARFRAQNRPRKSHILKFPAPTQFGPSTYQPRWATLNIPQVFLYHIEKKISLTSSLPIAKTQKCKKRLVQPPNSQSAMHAGKTYKKMQVHIRSDQIRSRKQIENLFLKC